MEIGAGGTLAAHSAAGDLVAILTLSRGAAEAIERLCEATANALTATDRRCMLAHLFSVLPRLGLDEAMVPEPLLTELATRAALAGAIVDLNERWACPSPRTLAAMAWAGVCVVAGSDSRHHRDVGVYRSVRLTAGAGIRA